MRLRLKASLLALALCSVASPALAHGITIEQVAAILATWGAVAGLIGGIATAALRFRALVGLGATIGIVMIGGVLIIQEMVALLLLFGVLPLVIAFFIASAAVSLVRAGVQSKRKKL
jgi:hypothetical protein